MLTRFLSSSTSVALACQRRCLSAQSIPTGGDGGAPSAVPSWVLCASLAEAHALTSIIVDAQLAEQAQLTQPTDLVGALALTARVRRQLGAALHVPRDVTLIDDLPMFLAECTRGGETRFSQMSEGAILGEFEEWVLTSLPPSEQPSTSGGADGLWAPQGVDTMPYLSLLAFLQSYLRYHGGVVWGASVGDGSDRSIAAFHHRSYSLHPWHGVFCPDGWERQMPYVHVLQWMMNSAEDAAEGEGTARDRLYRAHQAVEAFCPPSQAAAPADGGRSFSALDVCAQSGYGVDLLLKAGAARVLAVDAAAPALGSTEATVHEHMRAKRSGNLGGAAPGGRPRRREVDVRRCAMLPVTGEPAGKGAALQPSQPPTALGGGTVSTAAAAATFASAAARRRKQARSHGRAYDELQRRERRLAEEPSAIGPFDVLYYHPPVPVVWPLAALPAAPPRASVWWRLVRSELRRRVGDGGGRPPPVLPFIPAPSADDAAGSGPAHPHQSITALQAMVQRLRDDCNDVNDEEEQEAGGRPLLLEGGYAVCVLPRSYEPAGDAAAFCAGRQVGAAARRSYHGGAGDALSDYVVAQLDGLYDVALRRRHFTAEAAPALLAYMQGTGTSTALPAEQAGRFFGAQWWVDVLVMRKRRRPAAGKRKGGGAATGRVHPLLAAAAPQPVDWEDSFEFNEYKPREGAGTQYHWTDLVPTYSYLEDDFYGKGAKAGVERNFLAAGHPPQLRRPTAEEALAQAGTQQQQQQQQSSSLAGAGAARVSEAAAAAARFKSVFAEEMRQKRRTKLRKMALAPMAQQEWYIDEKLVKSEAAKVEFMNELSRWDFKDYDD